MKTITLAEAEKMLEQSAAGIKDAQVKIAALATGGRDADSINSAVIFLAECQGSYKAISRMTSILRWNSTHKDDGELGTVREELTEMVLRGADDCWSGRGNEIKRAEFDGVRKQVEHLLRSSF